MTQAKRPPGRPRGTTKPPRDWTPPIVRVLRPDLARLRAAAVAAGVTTARATRHLLGCVVEGEALTDRQAETVEDAMLGPHAPKPADSKGQD